LKDSMRHPIQLVAQLYGLAQGILRVFNTIYTKMSFKIAIYFISGPYYTDKTLQSKLRRQQSAFRPSTFLVE
jgi:hypothetical protein